MSWGDDYMHQWMRATTVAIAHWNHPVVVRRVYRCGKGHSTHARQVVSMPPKEVLYCHILENMVKHGYLKMLTISESEWHYVPVESVPWTDWEV